MKTQCEYCQAPLPEGVDLKTRRIRSAHFAIHAKERADKKERDEMTPLPEPVPFMAAQGQHVFTEQQMLDCIQAERERTIKECAAVCANADKSTHPADLADEIRNLKCNFDIELRELK